MSELNSNLPDLTQTFKHIQSLIESIELQLNISEKIDSTNSCLEQFNSLLNTYKSAYEIHQAEYLQHSVDFATAKSSYDDNSFKFTNQYKNFLSSISSLTQNIAKIEQNLEDLFDQLNSITIPDPDEKPSHDEDITLNSDYVDVLINQGPTSGKINTALFLIGADISQLIDAELKFTYTISAELTATPLFSFYSNQVLNQQLELNKTAGTHQHTLNFKYCPSEKLNICYFQVSNVSSNIILNNIYFKIKGKDVLLDWDNYTISINCFNNQYYIANMNNIDGKLYYGILDKNQLTLDTTNFDYVNLKDWPSMTQIHLLPALKQANVYEFDESYLKNVMFVYCNANVNFRIELSRLSEQDPMLNTRISFTGSNSSGLAVKAGGSINNCGYSAIFANPYVYVTLKDIRGGYYITYNDEWLKNLVYKAVLVKNPFLNIGDKADGYCGAILMHNDGTYYFYPYRVGNERLPIAKGKNVTACLQSDGSINVYICKGCCVNKYNIYKNTQTNLYELSNIVETIPQATKYEELYDGYALKTLFNTYEIVSPG